MTTLVRVAQFVDALQRYPVLAYQDTDSDTKDRVQAVVLLDSSGNIISSFGGTLSTGTRTTATLAPAGISASYATLINVASAIRSIRILNLTDGDVVLSWDGATDHWVLAPGKEFVESYGQNGMTLTDHVRIKDGTKVPANGAVYAIAYSV